MCVFLNSSINSLAKARAGATGACDEQGPCTTSATWALAPSGAKARAGATGACDEQGPCTTSATWALAPSGAKARAVFVFPLPNKYPKTICEPAIAPQRHPEPIPPENDVATLNSSLGTMFKSIAACTILSEQE